METLRGSSQPPDSPETYRPVLHGSVFKCIFKNAFIQIELRIHDKFMITLRVFTAVSVFFGLLIVYCLGYIMHVGG